ncbi:MAG: LptF/LptG family permease [Prevotellaceae bacterium]|nr:LptF/LptG family permease [Prevotellaceae bacterium]
MKTLYRHIFLSYLGPMFLTIFIVVFIFLIQFLWLWIDELVGKGLAVGVIFKFLFWASISNLSMALPLATLFASLMTMGNLGENNELLAMKSSGISLRRILYPLYWTILGVAMCAFLISSEIEPYAYLRMRTMLLEIRRTSPELSIPEDIFYDGIDKICIRVSHKNIETGALTGVMIYNHRVGEGNVSVTIADTAYIKQSKDARYILFRLINGVTYSESLKNDHIDRTEYPFDRRFFSEQTIAIDLGEEESYSFASMFQDNPRTKSLTTLMRDADSAQKKHRIVTNRFEKDQINSTVIFKHSLTDTLNKRRYELSYNTDSIFDASTAIQKMAYLENMGATASRVAGFMEPELKELNMEAKKLNTLMYERNKKFTLSFACIIFFLIGSSLGAIIRKGGLGMPAVVSILFFLIYHVVETICGKMVRNSGWSPIMGAWFSSFILAPLGIFFSIKANADSQLFNIDSYLRLFNTVFGKMKKLIDRVDLDKIVPHPKEMCDQIMLENSANVIRLENLILKYLDRHNSRSFMKNADDLLEIKSVYDYILSFYVTIDDDEKIRNELKKFPMFEPDEFLYSKFALKRGILKIPLSMLMIFIRIRRFKKLEYIFKDIININLNINKYIDGRKRTEYNR